MSSAARVSHGGRPDRGSVLRRPGVSRRMLVTLELVTMVTGLAGGVAWLGFQPLEVVFAVVGVTVVILAWRTPRTQP